MEVEGPEDHMVFPEQAINKDISDQESTPGIVPDGKNVFSNGYSLFSEENVYIQWIYEYLLKVYSPK